MTDRPSPIKAGSRGLLRLISPSGAVPEPDRVHRAQERLQALGFRVQLDSNALSRVQRFSGTDTQRVQVLHRAARGAARVVMATRGGYGLSRILHKLDYALLRDGINQRRQFWVGHSDFTALQLAVLAQTGSVTYSGPMAAYDFGAEKLDDITVDSFLDALDGSQEAIGFACDDAPRGLDRAGVLWGGNLSLVTGLIGTPYLPKARGVLFLEDVAEQPYRVERMFAQLLLAGVLQRQKAVVLGAFTDYRLSAHDSGFDLATAVAWLRSQLKESGVPVVTGLPFGHVRTKLTLPHGARCRLVRDGSEAYLVFPHGHD